MWTIRDIHLISEDTWSSYDLAEEYLKKVLRSQYRNKRNKYFIVPTD